MPNVYFRMLITGRKITIILCFIFFTIHTVYKFKELPFYSFPSLNFQTLMEIIKQNMMKSMVRK